MKNRHPYVKRVPISNCISGFGFSNEITESALKSYFEDERKSGGGKITDIKFNHEDKTFFVYFEDPTGKLFTQSIFICYALQA